MDNLGIELIKSITIRMMVLVDLEGLGLRGGNGSHSSFGHMTLGEFIIQTENMTTHKKLRLIGDKKLTLLKENIIETKEYKCIIENIDFFNKK